MSEGAVLASSRSMAAQWAKNSNSRGGIIRSRRCWRALSAFLVGAVDDGGSLRQLQPQLTGQRLTFLAVHSGQLQVRLGGGGMPRFQGPLHFDFGAPPMKFRIGKHGTAMLGAASRFRRLT